MSHISIRDRKNGCRNTIPHTAAILLALHLAMLCGCIFRGEDRSATTNAAPLAIAGSPTNFLNQIATADYVVVTNRIPESNPGYEHFRLKITGKRFRDLRAALMELKPSSNNVISAAICDWQFQFYKNTNLLATANFQGHIIICEGHEYYDHTGVVIKIYNDVFNKVRPPDTSRTGKDG